MHSACKIYYKSSRLVRLEQINTCLFEQLAHGSAGVPAGDAAGCSFGHFLRTAAGKGLDITQDPGNFVEQAPGFVYAHDCTPLCRLPEPCFSRGGGTLSSNAGILRCAHNNKSGVMGEGTRKSRPRGK